MTYRFSFEMEEGEEREILIAQLTDSGFEGFEELPGCLLAYINPEPDEIELLKNEIKSFGIPFSSTTIESRNWNQEWESDFKPVTIPDTKGNPFVHLRASFHQPGTGMIYELIITPRMSFGTGHHATTWLMIRIMSSLNFQNKTVADFGTGTGVLSILAAKMGAKSVLAIDNDDWSIRNANDNIKENHCSEEAIILQKADTFPVVKKFDIILANINRNIILANLEKMISSLHDDGHLIISGLLDTDEGVIRAKLKELSVSFIETDFRFNWIEMHIRK